MQLKSCLLFLFALLPWMALAQSIEVSGQVKDAESGNPLAGATVVEVGTTNGILTDDQGRYRLQVAPNATLLIRYIGFANQKIVVGEAASFDVEMESDYQNLDEVVVVGYTAQKKKDITGAISVVDLESIENSPYSNVLQSLQGKATGVTLTQDGQPGSGRTSIKIRGVTTLNNNNPLYVIDGVPTVEGLQNLNPNDIESIQILKDAASAAQYGSRSAGGVIVITTKKGKAGELNVSAGTQFGVQTLGRRLDVLNATEWGEVFFQAARNDNPDWTPNRTTRTLYGEGPTPVVQTTPFLIDNGRQIYQFTPEGTDWYDEVYSNAISQQHFVNLSNGSEKGNYMVGISYFGQDGLINKTYYDRITGRFNSELNITDWLQVGENFSVSFDQQVQIGNQQGQDGIPLDVIRQHPILPVYDLEGNFAGKIGGLPDVRNMVSVLEKNQDNTTDTRRLFGNAYIQADLFGPISGIGNAHSLILRSSFGIDYSTFYDIRFNAAFQEGDFDIQNNSLSNGWGEGFTRTWTNTLTYRYEQGDHNFSVLAGQEQVEFDARFMSANRNGFLIEDPDFTYLSAGSGDPTVSGTGDEWGLYSYFGRADYSFASKYILSATVRYDQTSRFEDAGFFPGGSVGWWLSEEDFMQGVFGSASSLKLRASYGLQGNQTASPFARFSTFGPNVNTSFYDITGSNNSADQGYVVVRRGNPNLRWEQTAQLNAGFDLTLADGRFSVIFDYYTKNTTGILLPQPLLAAQGEGAAPFANLASMVNQGIDLGLTHRLTTGSGFDLETQLQFTYVQNEVTDIPASVALIGSQEESYLPGPDGPTRIVVGLPVYSFYGWVADGIFQNEAEVEAHAEQTGKGIGRIRYRDINEDGIINDDDRDYLGNPFPDFIYGLNLIASYKNFSLLASFYGATGQQVYNEVKWYMDFAQNGNFNRSTRILDAWSPTNTGSDIPAPTLVNDNNENRASSYFVENADYLKMRNIRLSYSFPANLVGDFGLQVYGEAQNVFVLTNYTGIDPEVPFAGNGNVPGIDRGVYPLPRIFLLGLNFNL